MLFEREMEVGREMRRRREVRETLVRFGSRGRRILRREEELSTLSLGRRWRRRWRRLERSTLGLRRCHMWLPIWVSMRGRCWRSRTVTCLRTT